MKYKLGIIGGGHNSVSGHTHLSASALDNKFVAVAGSFSRDPIINCETAKFWSVKKYYNDYTELIQKENDQLDAYVVLLPTPNHFPVLKDLLQTSKPIICEKPLVCNVNEINELSKVVVKNNFLRITYNYTGYPLIRELKELVLNEALGKINHIRLTMPQESFVRPPKSVLYPQSWRKLDYEIPTICVTWVLICIIFSDSLQDKPERY